MAGVQSEPSKPQCALVRTSVVRLAGNASWSARGLAGAPLNRVCRLQPAHPGPSPPQSSPTPSGPELHLALFLSLAATRWSELSTSSIPTLCGEPFFLDNIALPLRFFRPPMAMSALLAGAVLLLAARSAAAAAAPSALDVPATEWWYVFPTPDSNSTLSRPRC